MKNLFLGCLLILTTQVFGQIGALRAELKALETEMESVKAEIATAQLAEIITQLKSTGLPSDDYIEHSAMILSYNEAHEQADWVAHMIIPDIKTGVVFRSNDFRIDPKVKSGTASQLDYFLTDTLTSGKVNYDGFGYDRGHLAPSADFRWNEQALSESYFYSNMSPQLPEFNQECWATLESHLRRYVLAHEVPLMVITVPLLSDNLPVVSRATNHLSIPKAYGKAIYDFTNKRMIAFSMDHQQNDRPLDMYAMTIDAFEEKYGLNVFTTASEQLESKLNLTDWFENLAGGDVDPIPFRQLPKKHYNTITAGNQVGNEISVCGQVVATRYSRSGHLWLNLDRQFPNQLFSIFIKKEDLVNFPYDLKSHVENRAFCFTGTVEKFSESPHINIKNEGDLRLF